MEVTEGKKASRLGYGYVHGLVRILHLAKPYDLGFRQTQEVTYVPVRGKPAASVRQASRYRSPTR